MSSDSSYPTVIKYQTRISNSAFEGLRGFSHLITEVWIPKHKLIVNMGDGKLNVFEEDAPRTPINQEEITVTESFIRIMKEFYDKRKEGEFFWEWEENISSPTTVKGEETK